MKVEVNLNKKFLVFSLIMGLMAIGFVGVYAYNSPVRFSAQGGLSPANPASFGHSVDEMDWTSRIPMINATSVCIGGDCRTAWPTSGTGGVNILAGSGIIVTQESGGIRINSTSSGGVGSSLSSSNVILPNGQSLQQYIGNITRYLFPAWDYVNMGYEYEPGSVTLVSFSDSTEIPNGKTPKKVKEAIIGAGGTVRASIRLSTDGNHGGYALIYRNGNLVGELGYAGNDAKSFTKDFGGWSPRDKLQLYVKSTRDVSVNYPIYVKSFKISVKEIPTIPDIKPMPTPTAEKTLG